MISVDPNGRLKNLRELHGMTQKQFAAELDIGQAQLSQIESGQRNLTDATMSAARYRFGVGQSFFQEEAIRYDATDLNYRTRKLSARERRIANVSFGLTEQVVRARNARSTAAPSLGITREDTILPRREIEAYAADARSMIGIPLNKVINNVTRCIERAGVLVTGLDLPANSHLVDGISTPRHTDEPFVMTLDLDKSGDRLRFSGAHEFGHILMHTDHRPTSDSTRESEADMFAGAFLLPREPMLDELSPGLTLTGYTRVKARWGVSVQAIIRRALDLRVIDQDRYRSLFIQLSSRGWRTEEPVEIPREKPAISTPRLLRPAVRPERPAGLGSASNVIPLFGGPEES